MTDMNENAANKLRTEANARQRWQERTKKRMDNWTVATARLKGSVTERGYKPTEYEVTQVVGHMAQHLEAIKAAWMPVNRDPGFSFDG